MAKKKYQVIKATTRELEGVYVGGRKRTFGRNGTFTTTDRGEAEEINRVLGKKGTGEVVVVSDNIVEHGHKYRFSGVDLKKRGGHSRVKVKTEDGYTFMSEEYALENGYVIIR